MYVWVIYDIQKNKVRQRIAKKCKYFGLRRVQKSVFLGKTKKKWLTAMHADLNHNINHRTDRLFIVPMSDSSLSKVQHCGVGPSPAQMVAEKKVQFI